MSSTVPHAGYIFFGSMVEISRRLRIIADSVARSKPLEDTVFSPALGGPPLQALEPLTVDAANSARTAARRFLLLDLRRVTGIDATTATSFASLSRSLTSRWATAFCSLSTHREKQRFCTTLYAADVSCHQTICVDEGDLELHMCVVGVLLWF